MLNKLEYLYYRIYMWQLRLNEISSEASATAHVVIMFLLTINVLTIAALVRLQTGVDFLDYYTGFTNQYHLTKFDAIIFLFVLSSCVEWVLRKRKFHSKLIEKYESETTKAKFKGASWIWCYIIGSIAIFFLSCHLLHISKNWTITHVHENSAAETSSRSKASKF